MKCCPSCNLKYADDTLQFCLNDGTQLVAIEKEAEEPPTIFASATKVREQSWATSKTNFGTAQPEPDFIEIRDRAETAASNKSLTDMAPSQETTSDDLFFKVLTFAPIVVALMQNYWQWLYMNDYYSFQFPAFLWTLRFWIWLILLGGGAALCILALRQSRNKGFAVVGLVVLAINLLLCLAPRK